MPKNSQSKARYKGKPPNKDKISRPKARYMEKLPARLTVSQAAKVVGCDTSTLRRLLIAKKLKGTKRKTDLGTVYWVITKSEVVRYMRQEQTTGYPRGRPRRHK